jgi:hypothetical protein
MLTFDRSWTVVLDDAPATVRVEYAALFGWMSIFVDGVRVARAWREWQSVWGGAELSCTRGGHRLEARVTQPYGRQEYSFALRVDGILQPGSDDLPPPRAVKRNTVVALGVLALVVAVFTLAAQLR